jgi:Spy/CpxP family protein refolding chaperone
MTIKRGRRVWIVAGLTIVAVLAAAAIGTRVLWAHPSHWGGPMMGWRAMLHELDLTADQKKQLAGILRTHKGEWLAARDKLAQAGRSMVEGMADQEMKPEALQGRLDAAAEAGKALGRIGIAMRREALALLTPQQKQDLAKRQQRFLGRMEQRSGERRQDAERHFDDWIEALTR